MATRRSQTPSQLESIYDDAEVMEEFRDTHAPRSVPEISAELSELREQLGSRDPAVRATAEQEAIILAFGRPSLLIRDKVFVQPESSTWRNRLRDVTAKLNSVIPRIGRVELFGHQDFEWVGTGWMIDDRTLATNRHVAEVFAARSDSGPVRFRKNPFGETIKASIDFREEHDVDIDETAEIERVLYMADAMGPDVAFMRLAANAALPEPIPLSSQSASEGTMIAVIGYPAWDGRRNGLEEMRRIFGDIFNVKRLAPGFVTGSGSGRLTHDCSTLGGNSGSPIIDASTGQAIGLHFAGRFLSANHGVDVTVVKRLLQSIGASTSRIGFAEDEDTIDEARTIDFYEDREGYKEDFFGSDSETYVPLPQLSAAQQVDAARIEGRTRESSYVLDYTHFSSVINGERKIAFFTAVNIDGATLVRPRRRRTRWQIDPRIAREEQAGNELYRHNRLDRGHLVRRLDPVWGSREAATEAENDTFHYTNAAPQHELLNQRDWVDLEDYLLDALAEHRLKASVFTGPVFADADRSYRGVKIPEAFWKIVILLGEDRRVSVTAYLLGQAAFLSDIEFAFGEFRTFQTSVDRVAEMTQLDFGRLRDHDPRSGIESFEQLEVMTNPAAALGI